MSRSKHAMALLKKTDYRHSLCPEAVVSVEASLETLLVAFISVKQALENRSEKHQIFSHKTE